MPGLDRRLEINLLTLPDGRDLQWSDNGIESQEALVFHHGTTVSLEAWNAWLHESGSHGVRAIAINRPGVGQSSRKPGRRVFDDISDTRELLNHLGITAFVAVGWSGGGARALGSSLIDGCVAVHTIAGISPLNPAEPESMAGIPEKRVAEIAKLRNDYSAVLKERSSTFEDDQAISAESALEILAQLPEYPKYEVEYRAFAEDFSQSIRTALANGPETDADDYFANITAWGFSLDQVRTPVTIWHGDADDNVGILRGEYNHRYLPAANFVRLEGQGHVSIMVEAREAIVSAAIESLNGPTRSQA